jgi:hypothetical protein
VREESPIPEHLLQCIWYDQLFLRDDLQTREGQRLRVISPGWWNRSEGPDFKGAQLEFNGILKSGDVEIHFTHASWRAHGHDRDPRYNRVLLHVVLEDRDPSVPTQTESGREVASLSLGRFLQRDLNTLADLVPMEEYPYRVEGAYGVCAALIPQQGTAPLLQFLRLAGQWRMLNKAKTFQDRMAQAGIEQALYEALLAACGYSAYKDHFRLIARHLPYERVRQLTAQDPLLLEAALFQMAGLLPESLAEEASGHRHYQRIRGLRDFHLAGLRPLSLQWTRAGVRPANSPERRLAGVARLLSRTAARGLENSLNHIWQDELSPRARRQAFEGLFARPMGFWANHCTWRGKCMERPAAPIGSGRIRSILGNVFVPAALASARQRRDRAWEEQILAFFEALPSEPDNQTLRAMAPRLLGDCGELRLTFQLQQGMLQVHQDWCEPNPSCRNCRALEYLGREQP